MAPLIPLAMAALPAIGSAVGSLFGGGDKDKPAPAADQKAIQGQVGHALSGAKSAAAHQADTAQIRDATRAAVRSEIGKPHVLAPHLESAVTQIAQRQAAAPIEKHQEQAARAQVRRVEAAIVPHLQETVRLAKERALQVQATAEHRRIQQSNQRYRESRQKQQEILQKLDSIQQRLNQLRLPRDWPQARGR